ncbi:MAG: protein PhnA [Planctomycetaceae bacterium]|jgi:protein PhnA
MSELPNCPECDAEYTYENGTFLACPSCGHEWNAAVAAEADSSNEPQVRDSNGNLLQNGDSVIVIKDLKLKGSSSVIKGGTKVKAIRLVDGDHNIDCKVDGIGAMQLKSEFVKKA